MIRKIDLFRAFLCQYVILAHLIPALFPGILGVPGTLAVWCFFVISGYLNFFSCRDSQALREYYFKRFIRLYPLLLLSFLIVCFFEKTIFTNDLYTLFPVILNIKDHMPHNGVLWTIIIELQLYLLTPLLFYAGKTLKIPDKFLPLSVISLFALSYGCSVIFSKLVYGHVDLDDRTVFSAIPFYAFGMLLAQGHFKPLGARSWTACVYMLLTVAIFAIVILDRNNVVNFDFAGKAWESLFTEGRFIPLLASLLVILYPLVLPLRTRVIEAIGKATYEVYLLHGLSIYVLYKMQPADHHIVQIIGFFWLLPTLGGVAVHFLISKRLNDFAKRLIIQNREDQHAQSA